MARWGGQTRPRSRRPSYGSKAKAITQWSAPGSSFWSKKAHVTPIQRNEEGTIGLSG
jgi:hypothetical protein